MFPYDTSVTPARPSMMLRITDNMTGLQLGPFPAVIDTGADVTCIPLEIAAQAGAMLIPQGVSYADGQERTVQAVQLLDLKIEFMDIAGNIIKENDYQDLLFLAIAEGVLGRDVLNLYVCEFDGPDQTCTINW